MEAVVMVLELYRRGSGLIISAGCEAPFKSPLRNMVRLRDVSERNRRY
jgi:hypothetical protein